MTYSRRDLCLLAAALAVPGAAAAQNQGSPGKAFPYEELPAHKSGENEFRPVLQGQLHNGGFLEVHETRLAPGGMPHPAHHHVHEEMFLVREGSIEFTLNEQATRLGPGSVGFAGSNDEHGLHNAGPTPAEYFVVAFGKEL